MTDNTQDNYWLRGAMTELQIVKADDIGGGPF